MLSASGEQSMRYHRERVISGTGTGRAEFADALRGLAIGAKDQVYAVGDCDLKVFLPEGKWLRGWPTERPGYSVAVRASGTVYVGQAGQVQIFDPTGKLLDTWRDADRLGLVTAIGFAGADVLLADAKERCIRRYDGAGKHRSDIGKGAGRRGFFIPNGHLDYAVDAENVIHAPNPGKHRVERYSLSGKLLGRFGRFDGRDPAGFSGCCNPTNIALTPEGLIVVTVKAEPGVKVYNAEGKLLAVISADEFDPRCKNMDVAVDSQGRIYVIDTARLHIGVYAPDKADLATPRATTTNGAAVKP
jgi:sugar lactone lactonase YvrE